MKRRFSEEKYEPESRSSPSVSSSHGEGGLADTETDANPSHSDAGPSQLSGIPSRSQLQETGVQAQQAAPPPQKKKRTRTLTTPHQSAVLHALLAQSRFPTTAMREEVGRSIGLSARKVQVWFQNQRQKARRPRSQSAVPPLTRPPQYGPFANSPSSAPAMTQTPYTSAPLGSASSYSTFSGHSGQRSAGHDHYNPEGYTHPRTGASSSPTTRLSGPGVPGPSMPFAPRLHPAPQPLGPPPPGYIPSSGYAEHWSPHEPPFVHAHGASLSVDPRQTPPVQREYAIQLPPLVLDERQHTGTSRSSFPPLAPPPFPSAPPHLDAFQPSSLRSPFNATPDSPFLSYPPRGLSYEPGSSSRTLPRLHIPTPYAQSSPRRNPTSLSPYALAGPSASSSTSGGAFIRNTMSSIGRPEPPTLPLAPVAPSWRISSPCPPSPSPRLSSSRTATPPSRPARFDPVRAAQNENNGGGFQNTGPPARRTPPDHTAP